jgi:hypothetical protein
VYDLPAEIILSLTLKDVSDAAAAIAADASTFSAEGETPKASSDNLVGIQACSLCNLAFASLQEQRSHLKSDLHHYNLKQKLRGRKAVTEAEFEKLIGGMADAGLSSSVMLGPDIGRPRRKPIRLGFLG